MQVFKKKLNFTYTKLKDPSKFWPSQVVVAQTASARLCMPSFIFGDLKYLIAT